MNPLTTTGCMDLIEAISKLPQTSLTNLSLRVCITISVCWSYLLPEYEIQHLITTLSHLICMIHATTTLCICAMSDVIINFPC